MTLDVAAARAAVNQAALVRDEEELRRIADSLPPLTAFGYERHRARAFANAIRGARDSAVAELCLGVAACPPAASTFVADSAQLRLLGGEQLQPAPAAARTPLVRRIDARVVASAAALAAAVTALAVLPGETLDRGRPEAAGVTAPADQADPRVVPGEPQVFEPSAVGERRPGESAEAPTLVSAPPGLQLSTAEGTAAALDDSAASATSRRAPSPRAPTPAPPASPRPPATTPASPPPAAPSAPATPPQPAASGPASTATPAAAPAKEPATPAPATRERGGRALGHAHAPGQLKDESTPATAFAPPTPAAPASPAGDPGQGNGGDPPGTRP